MHEYQEGGIIRDHCRGHPPQMPTGTGMRVSVMQKFFLKKKTSRLTTYQEQEFCSPVINRGKVTGNNFEQCLLRQHYYDSCVWDQFPCAAFPFLCMCSDEEKYFPTFLVDGPTHGESYLKVYNLGGGS